VSLIPARIRHELYIRDSIRKLKDSLKRVPIKTAFKKQEINDTGIYACINTNNSNTRSQKNPFSSRQAESVLVYLFFNTRKIIVNPFGKELIFIT
jgi:hypothetical protein